MIYRDKLARASTMVGLGLLLAFGPSSVAFADAGAADTPVPGEAANPTYEAQVQGASTGDTKLYVIGNQDDLVTSEGSATENMKVSIPVAIHYVADSEGNLMGPSDNIVKFVNHTKLGTVHVSKIAVQGTGDASIVPDSQVRASDQMSFYVTPTPGSSDAAGATFVPETDEKGEPVAGTQDELGVYVDTQNAGTLAWRNPTNKHEWDIAQDNGALALNGLTGRIGGFDKVNPATDYQAGTVHWTVRAGSRAQADVRDATVSIHFNSNDGSNANCEPLADQKVMVLKENQDGAFEADEAALQTALAYGKDDVVAPKAHSNADGSLTSYRFVGWNTQADGKGTAVATVADLGTAEELAGTCQEVYAIYEEG